MRDIRFRYWDTRDKVMRNDFFVWVWWDKIEICLTSWIELRVWRWNISKEFEDYPIMQYTWLKDSKWVEIYEWDIVDMFPEFWDRDALFEVYYDKWCFKLKDTWALQEILYKINDKCEVVGNIYQDKHLLK